MTIDDQVDDIRSETEDEVFQRIEQESLSQYEADHERLRREGISVSDYLSCAMRDTFPAYSMRPELRAKYDADQQRRFGPTFDRTTGRPRWK